MKLVQVALWAWIQMFIEAMANMGSMQGVTFSRSTGTRLGISQLMTPKIASSTASCAVECGVMTEQCYSFTYNKDSGLCTLGTKVSLQYPAVSSSQGQLYIKEGCDSTEGFELWEDQQVNMCVFMSNNDARILPGADKICREMGAKIIKVPTTQKFDLLVSKLSQENRGFWIGMDDRANEDQFVWTYDNSTVENFNVIKNYMFEPGQPDNNNNADCVRYAYQTQTFWDTPCTDMFEFNYLCEK